MSQLAKDNSVFFEFHPHSCLANLKRDIKSSFKRLWALMTFIHFTIFNFKAIFPADATSVPATNVDLPYSIANVNNSSNKGSKSGFSSSNVANLWHARLGHPNDHVMKIVLNHCNISHLNKSFTKFCFSCCMGKTH